MILLLKRKGVGTLGLFGNNSTEKMDERIKNTKSFKALARILVNIFDDDVDEEGYMEWLKQYHKRFCGIHVWKDGVCLVRYDHKNIAGEDKEYKDEWPFSLFGDQNFRNEKERKRFEELLYDEIRRDCPKAKINGTIIEHADAKHTPF